MYEIILLPIDGSEAAADAAAHAFSHAERYDGTVHVFSVVELSGGLGVGDRDHSQVEQLKTEQTETAEQLIEETAPDGIETEIVVETGNPARAITEYAAQVQADLTVMSTHARSGAGRFLFGSVTEQVIQDSDTPVLAVQRQ